MMKKIFGAMFCVGALLLCLTGYMTYSTYQFQQQAVHVEGKVTDLRYSRGSDSSSAVWYPEVTFKDNTGKVNTFESSVGSTSYRNSLGNIVDVIYRNGDVSTAKINDTTSLYLVSIVTGSFSIALLFFGGGGFCITGKGSKYKRLMHEGKPLSAQVVSVELNKAIEFNGRSPWRIVCQWLDPQTNQVYVFNSPDFYYDPEPYMKSDSMTVYVSYNNFKKYYMDVSEFPKKA